MSARATGTRRGRTKDPNDPIVVDALVRQLIARAADTPTAPAPEALRDGSVLFEREVDGVRCVIARTTPPASDACHLSPREQEIARMIAKGHPNKVVASVLDISVWTVSTHLRRIYAKLGVTTRAAMVAHLFKAGGL